MLVVQKTTVPSEGQPGNAPPTSVGSDNTVAAVFALLMFALGLIVIWSRLRARGRKFVRRHRRTRSARASGRSRPTTHALVKRVIGTGAGR